MHIEMTDKSPNEIRIIEMKKRMLDIEHTFESPTMCLAKWLQSTVYLMNGHTHSCHHPNAHFIPVSEIKRNPAALHNTEYKMTKRLEMLSGERPKECQYCWNVEDLPGDHMSDRTYKSANPNWGYPFTQRVLDSGVGEDIMPSYLEVAFENTCNLKCMYCSPDISSKWMEESERYGPYPTTTKNGDLEVIKWLKKMPIPHKENNPYVDAFWQWWPDLYKNLETFRITGGEPLLSKNTWKVLEHIKANPRKDFTISINTNMMVPDDLITKLIGYYNDIAPHVKRFHIFTSVEAHGKQADYIRTGMEYNRFMKNCRRYLTETHQTSSLDFMITFNALCVSTFDKFLLDIIQLRKDFNQNEMVNRVPMMINYLRWPDFQDVRVLPTEIKDEFATRIKAFANQHTTSQSGKTDRLYLEEIDQIERLLEYMYTPYAVAKLEEHHKNFGAFFQEYEKRRNVNFPEHFPELAEFYKYCLTK
jgi:organic radical activating enzyme